jgi:beta-N-acetylhexosaminidase
MKQDLSSPGPLIIDIASTHLTADDRRRLVDPLVGGLIYFSRNWESRAQITALSAEIKSLRADLLICVDHEGGRVQRFRSDGFTHLPSMRSLGQKWMPHIPGPAGQDTSLAMDAMDLATATGYVMGAELRACGIDLTLAPVLDLDWGPSSVIGDRAFHRDPRVVATLAKSVIHGLLQSGMQHCGKHFPGHGFAHADSHTDTVIDERELAAILADDVAPYGWLGSSLSAVMPAHVVYPRVDSKPAGFSSVWLQDILRTQLGFTGAIISDDLSMEAARRLDGRIIEPAEAAKAALDAGCDMVLLCNQSLEGGAVLDTALQALGHADSSAQRSVSAARSTESMSRRRRLMPAGTALGWADLKASPSFARAERLLALK